MGNLPQAKLAADHSERSTGERVRRPALIAGLLFDGDGYRMTPSHAVKKGTPYHHYVSRPLLTEGRVQAAAGLRIPAAEIEQIVTERFCK